MPRATGEISTLKLGPFIREPTSSALHVYCVYLMAARRISNRKVFPPSGANGQRLRTLRSSLANGADTSGHFWWARVDGNQCVWPSKALTFM